MIKSNKNGQIAVFVILAIAIVAVLAIVFLPNIKRIIIPSSPEVQMKECLEENLLPILDEVMLRGGEIEPELYYLYNEEKIGYLCYTNEWYETCVMQKPLLKQVIEDEVEANIQDKARICIREMEDKLKSKGYSVNLKGSRSADVKIVPGNIIVTLDLDMNAQKDSQKLSFDKFKAQIKSKAYKMIMTASSISNWEARYGDSSPTTYMGFYSDLKVEKKKQPGGTTIYIISEWDKGESEGGSKLQFASRSVAWPPGYAG